MSKKFLLLRAVIAAFTLFLVPALGVAADHMLAASQVIVTASRTPMDLNRVGNSATVITHDEIEQRQARYVTDVLRSVPGFSLTRSGVQGTRAEIRLRGSESNHVLVLIDGVRANDPAIDDGFRWEQLTTGNIERIEIVRGPQSALWGSDAIAGVVNIVTRRGDATGADGYIEGGSNRSSAGGINGRTRLSNWTFSGGLERIKTDGENISRGSGELDDSDTSMGSFRAGYDDGAGTGIDFSLRAVDAFVQTDAFTTQPVDANETTNSKSLAARLSGRVSTLDGKWGHQVAVDWFDSDNRYTQSGLASLASRSDRLKLTYQSNIHLGDDTLALAVEHEQTDFQQRGPVTFGDPNQDQKMDVTSLIADYQALSGNLTWLFSLRYDDNSDFNSSVASRASLSYALNDATTLRAGIGTARKNPTFSERFGFFAGQFLGNPDLKPERSLSYEAGIDQSLFGNTAQLQLTAFHHDLRDEINGFVFDAGSGLFTAENRDGKSRRSGLELAAIWSLHRHVDAGLNYTYLSSKQKDSAGASVHETRSPRHNGGLWATYNSAEDGFRLMLAADYGGSRTDQYFGTFPATLVKLNHYWLIDVTAEFKLKKTLSIYVRGTNAFDADYEEVFGYNTPGRQFYAGLRMSFGD